MARRRSSAGRSKRSASPPARKARSKSAPKSKAAAPVEVVEEAEGGAGIDAGIAIATTLALVAAFLFVDALRGQYGEGMFFK